MPSDRGDLKNTCLETSNVENRTRCPLIVVYRIRCTACSSEACASSKTQSPDAQKRCWPWAGSRWSGRSHA